MPTKSKKKSDAVKFLESLVGPETFGSMLEAFRMSDEATQVQYADRLGISKQHLNDIEKGRKLVSPERAAEFAAKLGYSEEGFVQLAIQDQLNRSGLKYQVNIKRIA